MPKQVQVQAQQEQDKQYQEYLKIIASPDKIEKLAKLEFLNADGTVAFVLDNTYKPLYSSYGSSRAFLQDGTLNVSLQNGQRRKADIVLENLDGAFDYNVNKQWFGRQIRLSMGVKLLSSGYDYYLPQGVFYLDSPQIEWKPNSRQAQYSLTDKWAYLDGSLFGTLLNTYEVAEGENIFYAMQQVLRQSRFTQYLTTDPAMMLDSVTPIFTDHYNTRTTTQNGKVYSNAAVPYKISVEQGQSYADILLELNDLNACWIGYNSAGALTVVPSEDDVPDQTKPVLWSFDTNSKTFFGLSEQMDVGEVYNDVTIVGEALNDEEPPRGRAINNDPTSDTAVDLIGRKSYIDTSDGYYTNAQCQALAVFKLKRMTALPKSVTVECTQMFHLQENNLITVRRTDKYGSPIERHLIQSFSIPLNQTGTASITAVSVSDFPTVTVI